MLYLLSRYLKTGLWGGNRLTCIAANRLKSLQNVLIDTDYGKMYVDLRIGSAQGMLAYGRLVTGETEIIKRFLKKDHIAYDIGAHWGFYSILMASLAKEVHSFEPNPMIAPLLTQTAERYPNMFVHPIALSDEAGTVDFFIPELVEAASLRNWTVGYFGKVETIKVEAAVFDSLDLPPPDFIKCDTEGAELKVFRGGERLFAKKPVVIFEAMRDSMPAFENTPQDLDKFFKSKGYRFFLIENDGKQEPLESVDLGYGNVLALPPNYF
jgi:FkbM family methyltransferase